MIKKLVSFACCLLPIGAGAVPVSPENSADTFVSTESAAWQNAASAGQTIEVGADAQYPVVNSIVSENGFTITNNMYYGMAPQGSSMGDLYVLSNVTDPFTVVSQGDISVGAILQVLDGKNLAFKSADTNPVAFDITVGNGGLNQGIFVGSENGSASLSMQDVDKLFVDAAVTMYGDLTVAANSVDIGKLEVNTGNTSIDAAGTVSVDGFTVSGDGATIVKAGGNIVSDGTVQNNAGLMQLTAGNNLTVAGNLENAGAGMEVAGSAVNVSGAMKNDSDGVLTMNVASWTVGGGSVSDFSFVNSGDLYATVQGQTYMEYGISLDGMDQNKVFNLDTGTLVFGIDTDLQSWTSVFSNSLDSFSLAVRQGTLDLSGVALVNGADANTDAEMSLLAQGIAVKSIANNGASLSLMATNGNITVGGDITGASGATSQIIAQGTLSAAGIVSNQGAMTLNANKVLLNDVSNSGAGSELKIASGLDDTSVVQISGNLSNTDGAVTVFAKDVSVSGVVTNNGGSTTIRGSDTNGGAVQIGAVNAFGGTVNLDALAGDIDINSTLTATQGMVNLGAGVTSLSVGDGVGSVQISNDVIAAADGAVVAGDMGIKAGTFVLSAGVVDVAGDINVSANDTTRNIQFDSVLTNVASDVIVANQGLLTLGKVATAGVNITGSLSVDNGGIFESYANDIAVGSLGGNGGFLLHGSKLTANAGSIDVDGNLYFDPANDQVSSTTGMIVRGTNELTIQTVADGADIAFEAVSVGAGNTLKLDSAYAIDFGGALSNNGSIIFSAGDSMTVAGGVSSTGDATVTAGGAVDIAGDVVNSGALDITATSIEMANVTNTGAMDISATSGAVTMGDVSIGGDMNIVAQTTLVAGAINQTAGTTSFTANTVRAGGLVVGGMGSSINLDASGVMVDGTVSVAGNMLQGHGTAMLSHNAATFDADNLIVGGNMDLTMGETIYTIGSNVRVTGDINVGAAVSSEFVVGNTFTAGAVTNSGDLSLSANRGIELGVVTNTGGIMNLNSGTGVASLYSLNVESGNVVLQGTGLNMTGALNTDGVLYQGRRGSLADMDINIKSSDYTLSAANFIVGGINQNGKMLVESSDIEVDGDITATDLRFVATPTDNWMNVSVDGNIIGDVDFIGLEKMTVGGDYVFNSGSNINAVILPYAVGGTFDSTDVNYWSTVGLNSDNMIQIENAQDGGAMISVGGTFTAGQSAVNLEPDGAGALKAGQIGISLRDVVDQGTAIWFVHADDGVFDAGDLERARNLTVRYCNADGSMCYDYLESLDLNNGTDDNLPVYMAVRENDLYIVFDPRFGGPVQVFKLQPVVDTVAGATRGEYVSSGALDNLIAGRLYDKKFFNSTPIEVIPLVFQGTNMQEMADELYNRMEYYATLNRTPDSFARFARLFQARELEMISGGIVLNEHTAFRSFEDRMFDEFIWNRNRNLEKAWVDIDYGALYQNISDGKHTDGNRFSISGGFDWQESNTLQLGLTGRISRTTSKAGDRMDLGYMPGQSIAGNVDIQVADTNIGLGGYLMKIVSDQVRIYGNAFLDMHILDVKRDQNYVGTIDGDGAAFSLISEWGIMHDLLNQYVVGNLYARAGYNFGFEVKEKVGGDDYMRLQSDGYAILTPGYSITAQKRIYPSAWFQIRPYASIGVEYDILGAPDTLEYKFAPADSYTKYSVENDPLWMNIGGGVEVLSARGLQFGIDYRYQYNSEIQLHNVRFSGSYRF